MSIITVSNSTTSVSSSTTNTYVVANGGVLTIVSGGNVGGTQVQSGGKLVVSGGTESAAIISAGGTEVVSKGAASGDLIYGTASTISGGAGTFTNETVENGGTLNILNGNSAAGTTVLSGGSAVLSGNNGAVTSTVLSGGGFLELNSPKANISGSLTFAGGGNTLDIAVVATAPSSSGSYGDLATISGFSATDKIDVTVFGAAATLTSFVSSGGNEIVTVSGTGGSETLIFSGTTAYTSSTLSVVAVSGREYVEYGVSSSSSGMTTSVTTSTAPGIYTETSGNTLLVLANGSVSAAKINNGGFLVISGGSDTGAIISAGGSETVSAGLATGDQIYGNASVSSGATVTSETVQNSGTLTIASGGIDNAATILSGGIETVLGSATGDLIYGTISTISGGTGAFTNEIVENGGQFYLLNGNTAAGTTVLSSGLFVLSGNNAAVTSTVLNGGGTLELDSPKANISGSLSFQGGGNTLDVAVIADAGYGDLATISGFSSTDKIDVTVFGSGATLSVASSGGSEIATVSGSGVSESFIFSGTTVYTSATLGLVTSGGLEFIEYSTNGFAGNTTSVTTQTASGAYTETSGNTLLVLNGGSVSAATIGNGAFLVVSGGTDTGSVISSGGIETVSAGSATGDQIFGSAAVVGGSVAGETVESGGQLTLSGVGIASNTFVSGGGLVNLASPTAALTGTLTFGSGVSTLEASAIATSGYGDQAVISGFTSADKIDVTGISPTGATLTFAANADGSETATISGTGGSESFIFASGTVPTFSSGTIAAGGTMTLVSDGSGGTELVLDTTPVVSFTSLNGLQTNQATYTVNGTVNTAVDPEAIGTTVSIFEGNTVVGTGTVGANGYWAANVTFTNDDGANVLTAAVDGAGNKGVTSQSLTYNVNTSAAAFTAGNLVISISGDGDGSGAYTDNQAAPITLEQITTSGTIVSQLVLPETTTVVNGVTEYAISGEYGSSSEGTLELSADGHSLVIAGYGVNDQTYNAGGAAVYGNAAEAQSTSVPGGTYTAVPRVIADINANGFVDTSTALYNVFNTNNPRSVATVNGSSFYIGGQGVKGDTTQGVFYATDGASSATSINSATDVRTAEIYNGQLYVSADSTQGATNISSYGALPTSTTTPVVLTGLGPSVTLNGSNGNSINNSTGTVYLSPENFFFANSTTLYVADGGVPKNGGLGDGGLQKWSLVNGSWTLDYTLSAGLNLIPNTTASTSPNYSGDTGLIGLTGQVNGGSVQLYATTEPLTDLGQTAVVEITDTLSATTETGESFTTLLTASPGENIRGIALAPTTTACYCRGTLILTARGDVPVEELLIGDELITVSGEARPIKWIGRRSYGGRFMIGRKDILPICIKTGALSENIPKRDLWISPHHAMLIDGMLIEGKDLVNGVTIVQAQQASKVEYFHIELETHDVLLAEGAASETFIDDDSRGMFHNAHEFAALYPADAAGNVFAAYCAPRIDAGAVLDGIRRRINRRAGIAMAEPKTLGGLRGQLDRISDGTIYGWAQNLDYPSVPVCLDIVIGGVTVAQTLAALYRADLAAAGIGDGCHAFEVRLPQALSGAQSHTIEIRRSADGESLLRSSQSSAA